MFGDNVDAWLIQLLFFTLFSVMMTCNSEEGIKAGLIAPFKFLKEKIAQRRCKNKITKQNADSNSKKD